jgi:hypothetical protein
MSHPGGPLWERLLWSAIAAVIGLELLAAVLPLVLVALVVLAAVVGVLRLIWWYTRL